MSNNPNNIRLSACRVRWGGRDLGLTKGGVDVTIKTDTKVITVDQFGQSIMNEYVVGRSVIIKCPFAETDIDTLYQILRAPAGSTQPQSVQLNDLGTTASATITISAQPTANDTLLINGHTFTFVASASPALDQITIGSSVATTIVNAIAVIQQSSDPVVQNGTYVGTATTITVSYFRSGVVGNSFTLARTWVTGASCTLSGASLSGGVDGTRNVTILTGIGQSLLANTFPLVLHPADRADNDLSEDLTVFQAGQSGGMTFAYKIDNERVFMMDFMGFPNTSTKQLLKFGI